jgi:hypothetical protein
MSETHFHRVLRARISEVLVARSNDIASGVCKTLEHYKEEVGYMKGLKAALDIADDIEKDMDR